MRLREGREGEGPGRRGYERGGRRGYERGERGRGLGDEVMRGERGGEREGGAWETRL